MCVRCGTGAIAWCTDPNKHEDEAPSTPVGKVQRVSYVMFEDDLVPLNDAEKATIRTALRNLRDASQMGSAYNLMANHLLCGKLQED